MALNYLGTAAYALGEYQEARRLQQEALALSRELEDRFNAAYALQGLGRISHALGEYAQAREHFEESLSLSREIGDLGSVAQSLTHQGDTLLALGDLDSAQGSFVEAIRLAHEAQAAPILLEALAGEADRLVLANHKAAAHELLTHVFEHPAASHAARERARRLLASEEQPWLTAGLDSVRARPFEILLNDLLSRSTPSVPASL